MAHLPATTSPQGTLTPPAERDIFHSANASPLTSAINSQAASVTSNPSSSSLHQTSVNTQPKMRRRQNGTRRLPSQYPNDTENGHVEFILVAAFDIDRGSVMEHQYPCPISGDETMLAELMLPDQVHCRSQDWTIFFLHKESTKGRGVDSLSKLSSCSSQTNNGATDQDSASEEEEDSDAFDEGPPLIYVLNHVNTKHDSTVTR